MKRWLYRIIITPNQSEEESLINHLHDGGYYPKCESHFEHLAKPDKNRGLVLQIDVEDDEHKNAAELMISFFTGEIIQCIPQKTIGFWCRLARYTKKRSWNMLAIFFGSFTVVLATLIKINGNQITLPSSYVFLWQVVLAIIPSIAYFIGGLKKFNSRFLADD